MQQALANLVNRARSQQITFGAEQRSLSQRWLEPVLDELLARTRRARTAADREFHSLTAQTPVCEPASFGEATPATYPIGFCQWICNAVWARLATDELVARLRRRGVLWKKVFCIGEGCYFQNVIQAGDYLIDPAFDSLDGRAIPVVCTPLATAPVENLDHWARYAAVARAYYHIDVYPNRYFPLLFPLVPFLAVRSSGRLELLFHQQQLFLLDLSEDWRRIRELTQTAEWQARTLPESGVQQLSRLCGDGSFEQFPCAFRPSDDHALLDALQDWRQLRTLKPKALEHTMLALHQLTTRAASRLRAANIMVPVAAGLDTTDGP
jgi:hypothetical protein